MFERIDYKFSACAHAGPFNHGKIIKYLGNPRKAAYCPYRKYKCVHGKRARTGKRAADVDGAYVAHHLLFDFAWIFVWHNSYYYSPVVPKVSATLLNSALARCTRVLIAPTETPSSSSISSCVFPSKKKLASAFLNTSGMRLS